MTSLDISEISLKKGKASDLSLLITYIQTKFKDVKIKIRAKEGALTHTEYEDKIEEAVQ